MCRNSSDETTIGMSNVPVKDGFSGLDEPVVQLRIQKISFCEDRESKKIKPDGLSSLVNKWDTFKGTFYSVAVGLLFSVTPSLVKYLHYHPMELVTYRFLGSTIFALPLVLRLRCANLNRLFFKLIAVAAVIGSTNTCARYQAFKLIPLVDANSIVFSTPIFQALTSRIILKEKISRFTMVSLVISITGLCMTLKLPYVLHSQEFRERFLTLNHFVGCAYAFLSVFCGSIYTTILRKLRNNHESLITFWHSFFSFVLVVLVAPIFVGPTVFSNQQCSSSSWILVTFCLIHVPINLLLNKALQCEQSCFVAMLGMSVEILCSFTIQITYFRDPIDSCSLSGAILVVLAGLLLPFRKWLLSKPDNFTLKKKLSWLSK